MSVETIQSLEFWVGWGVVALVLGLVVFFPLRAGVRGIRMKAFACRNRLRWVGSLPSLPASCRDLGSLTTGIRSRNVNCIGGERGGRALAAFDHHVTLPSYGPEARAHMSMLLTGWVYWFLLPAIGRARDPGFTAVVIECDLPPGVRTAFAKSELQPWTVEFGGRASVIHRDGYCSPEEMLGAADRLNAALDRILAGAVASAA